MYTNITKEKIEVILKGLLEEDKLHKKNVFKIYTPNIELVQQFNEAMKEHCKKYIKK